MIGFNKCLFMGNLGADPEFRYTPSGKPVANFDIAINGYYRKDGVMVPKVEWIEIVCFGSVAEFVGSSLKKGSRVLIEGQLSTKKWDDRDGRSQAKTQIICHHLNHLDRNPRSEVEDFEEEKRMEESK